MVCMFLNKKILHVEELVLFLARIYGVASRPNLMIQSLLAY